MDCNWKMWRIFSHRFFFGPSLITVLCFSSSTLRMMLLPGRTLTQIKETASVGKTPWRRNRLSTPLFLGFPGGSDGTESTCNAGDLGSIPGLERSPGGGKGYPLQHSGLENPHGQWSLWAAVHGVAESDMTAHARGSGGVGWTSTHCYI